jgi:nucleoside phosphorylase
MARSLSHASIPPDKFDFAVITVNIEEFNAINNILSLHRRLLAPDASGSTYYWGELKNDKKESVYVIHGTTGDEKNRNAEDLTRHMTELFDPDFILALGTAGGFKARECYLGQVVYSRLVRSSNNRGHLEEIDFEETGNLPPDERLINLANEVARRNKWQTILLRKGINPPETAENGRVVPKKTEIFSGPDRIDNVNDPLVKAILTYYPKVAAVEMEAGEVARAVLPFMRLGKPLGYLMIKGITDLPDDDSTPIEQRKARRRAWATYASASSAAFARQVICSWERDERTPSSRYTTVPIRYQNALNSIHGLLHNSRALVLHHLHPTNYSELSKIYSTLVSVERIFTVCAFEPNYFINKISAISRTPLERLTDEEFLNLANGEFEHFKAFRELSKRNINVTRIMLVRDSYKEWANRNEKSLELFSKLNGEVKCYIAEVDKLRKDNLCHMTDHVIFNSNLWLDYYDDSQTLIMTYTPTGPVQKEFTAFEKHFEQRKDGTIIYMPLSTFATAQHGTSQANL